MNRGWAYYLSRLFVIYAICFAVDVMISRKLPTVREAVEAAVFLALIELVIERTSRNRK